MDLTNCLTWLLFKQRHGPKGKYAFNGVILQLFIYICLCSSSGENILGVAQNVIASLKQQQSSRQLSGPVILNCISGSERSGVVALAITSLFATHCKRPTLISKQFFRNNNFTIICNGLCSY